MSMKKIGVIGSSDSVRGFAALGLSVFEANEAETAASLLNRLAENEFAIIYITEFLYEKLSGEIDKFACRQTPAVIPIPGTFGNSGIGMANVSRAVEKAVGSDILSGE